MIAELPAVVSDAERFRQMESALAHGFPMLQKAEGFHDGKASIVGYGPSLRETWPALFGLDSPIVATSGAYDFLLSKGLIADYYIAMDPRPSVVDLIEYPQHKTRYLLASCCHPRFWEKLRGFNVTLWHLLPKEAERTLGWVAEHHPEGRDSCIGGGSTVGHRALNVMGSLGYRRFDVFGLDCSFSGEDLHAGPHNGQKQNPIRVTVGGRPFWTTPQFYQSARELQEFLQTADVETTVHGVGLLQQIDHILKEKRHA